jgi:hypothetical protein
VCFLANVGQDEPWDEVEKKALKIGAEKMVRALSIHTASTKSFWSVQLALLSPSISKRKLTRTVPGHPRSSEGIRRGALLPRHPMQRDL